MSENGKDDRDLLLEQAKWLPKLAHQLVGQDRAEDIVQETLLRSLTSPPRDRKAVGPWLERVLINEARRTHRDNVRRRQRERRVVSEPFFTPEDKLERREVNEVLAAAVTALPKLYRIPIVLHYYDGLKASAIAAHLRVPQGTVRTRMRRGEELLRRKLDRVYGDGRTWAIVLVARLRLS